MTTINSTLGVPDTIQMPYAKVNFKEIQTRGFTLVRNFLDQRDIDFLLSDYNGSVAQNGNYPMTYAGPEVMPFLRDKLMSLTNAITSHTSTKVDTDQGAVYFSVKKGINFPWHQDHESFYMNQNHIDYINFYMIIVKEKLSEANLNVVPFDRLKARSPEYHDKLIGRGAISYKIIDGQTHIHSDEPGGKVGVLPYDIGTLKETPELRVGDLLILRGDSIHSTQISNSARVALSVRMVNSKNKISLKKMVNGNRFKMTMLMNSRHTFSKIFNAFRSLKSNESTYEDLIRIIAQDNSSEPTKFQFFMRTMILRIKLLFS